MQVGIWHTLLGATDSESVYTSTSFATLEADLMNELINVQGFTNIRYYAGVNEPAQRVVSRLGHQRGTGEV